MSRRHVTCRCEKANSLAAEVTPQIAIRCDPHRVTARSNTREGGNCKWKKESKQPAKFVTLTLELINTFCWKVNLACEASVQLRSYLSICGKAQISIVRTKRLLKKCTALYFFRFFRDCKLLLNHWKINYLWWFSEIRHFFHNIYIN